MPNRNIWVIDLVAQACKSGDPRDYEETRTNFHIAIEEHNIIAVELIDGLPFVLSKEDAFLLKLKGFETDDTITTLYELVEMLINIEKDIRKHQAIN